jgi:hypothetical protein
LIVRTDRVKIYWGWRKMTGALSSDNMGTDSAKPGKIDEKRSKGRSLGHALVELE